ncbi:hypothetical protein, partial [Sphingobacterium siyangense]|uniref:hypothetical protein n=1 Tax=Sphingobacterium siyangense TaxID=459529 RepID=UPI0031F881C6
GIAHILQCKVPESWGQFTPEYADEARRQKFELLKNLKVAVDLLIELGCDINSPELVSMIDVLKHAITPNAEFSSMAIDLLQDWPHIR